MQKIIENFINDWIAYSLFCYKYGFQLKIFDWFYFNSFKRPFRDLSSNLVLREYLSSVPKIALLYKLQRLALASWTTVYDSCSLLPLQDKPVIKFHQNFTATKKIQLCILKKAQRKRMVQRPGNRIRCRVL